MILESELIVNPDGSIFHLCLKPGQVADTVILVGDPKRVGVIGAYLSNVEFTVANREYVSTTGFYNDTRITVLSTGVGVGNIDIVLNELDALVNIDFETRQIKKGHKKLNLVRIGTSGSLQRDILVNSYVLSEKSVGFDNLLHYYDQADTVINTDFSKVLKKAIAQDFSFFQPYVIDASKELFDKLNSNLVHSGVTITSPGFYVPQGRKLRVNAAIENINDRLSEFEYNEVRITNYEMESAALYGLARVLGHQAVAICLIAANRFNKDANLNYREKMKTLIEYVLDNLTR